MDKIEQLKRENRELKEALAGACTKMSRAVKNVEDNFHLGRLERILDSSKYRKLLRELMGNEVIIRKVNDSTLTSVDIRYEVIVKLLTGFDSERVGVIDNRFVLNAASPFCRDRDEAMRVVQGVGDMLEYQGIKYEILDETGEDDES